LADKDPVHAGFVDFTGLGLAEITRKKEGQRLEELVVDTAGTKL
jgi:Ribonuclease G/E